MRAFIVSTLAALAAVSSPAMAQGPQDNDPFHIGCCLDKASVQHINNGPVVSNAPIYTMDVQLRRVGPENLRAASSLTVQSGDPAVFMVHNTRGYVRQISTNHEPGALFGLLPAREVDTVKTDSVTTGYDWRAFVSPRDDGKLALDWTASISWLRGKDAGFTNATIDGRTIQLLDMAHVDAGGRKFLVTPGQWSTISLTNGLVVSVRVVQQQGI